MASNYTTNYNLCQWQPTDQVQRTDFNADNARLEAALSSLEARVSELYRAVPRVAYTAYNLLFRGYYDSRLVGYQQGIIFERFTNDCLVSEITGSAYLQNNAIHISGQGSTGAVTSVTYVVDKWTRAIGWVRCDNGGVSMSINGVPMVRTGSGSALNYEGNMCIEPEFTLTLNEPGSTTVSTTLSLECLGDSNTVYDFGVIFL